MKSVLEALLLYLGLSGLDSGIRVRVNLIVMC